MNRLHQERLRIIEDKSKALKCPVLVVKKRVGPQADLWYVKPIQSQYKSELGTNQRSGKLTTINQIRRASPDLAMYLGVSAIRVRHDQGYIVLEIPKQETEIIWRQELGVSENKTRILLGKDVENNVVSVDIAKRPHILIGGATGMGKSVMLHTIILGLLPIAALVMIDPKHVEFEAYRTMPHALVITDKQEAVNQLRRTRDFMDNYLKQMSKMGTKDFEDVSDGRVAIVIDELASLTLHSQEARDLLVEIAERGRVAGIHLVVATQTPKANVISTNFRNNCGIRIAFSVPDHTASHVILGRNGAQYLQNPGDGLLLDGNELTRFQAAMTDLSYLEDIKREYDEQNNS